MMKQNEYKLLTKNKQILLGEGAILLKEKKKVRSIPRIENGLYDPALQDHAQNLINEYYDSRAEKIILKFGDEGVLVRRYKLSQTDYSQLGLGFVHTFDFQESTSEMHKRLERLKRTYGDDNLKIFNSLISPPNENIPLVTRVIGGNDEKDIQTSGIDDYFGKVYFELNKTLAPQPIFSVYIRYRK